MKRFYEEARAEPGEGGWQILLDSRPVNTPGRHRLLLPNEALAQAVAAEWAAQQDRIDPRSMPLTGLANAAVERIAPEAEAFAGGLARYGESDLLCYRAGGPAPLVARQDALWDPILAWARWRYDVDFVVTAGIVHRPQPAETVERLRRAVAARGPFELAALSHIVTVSSSVVIGLALAERAVAPDVAWSAASVDEAWQLETWGEDAEARAALDARHRDFSAGARLIALLGSVA